MPEIVDVQKLNKIIETIYQIRTQEDCSSVCDELKALYTKEGELIDNLRHEYSAISGKLIEINIQDRLSVQLIAENINRVYDYACLNHEIYLKNLLKLKDHINLEASRISYTNNISESLLDSKVRLQQQIDEMENKLQDIQKSTKEAVLNAKKQQADIEGQIENSKRTLSELNQSSVSMKNKLEKMHDESITILGVFSAVVLAFNGGMLFASSVLENMHLSSMYRVLAICIVLGIILLNLIYLMFYFITNITLVKKYRIIVYPRCMKIVNMIMIVILTCVVMAWFFDFYYIADVFRDRIIHKWIR